ncbi:hypothetical protein [Neisseria animaloris]|uniref:hypothetical protein n=1 Tax=Neisseria animaloris TaxID=326522 RepID=UPI000F8368FA|nr:hypothetical protein [Neisseria animaloris]
MTGANRFQTAYHSNVLGRLKAWLRRGKRPDESMQRGRLKNGFQTASGIIQDSAQRYLGRRKVSWQDLQLAPTSP